MLLGDARPANPWCYTDASFRTLGDKDEDPAPVRRVFPIMSDGDKYAKVLVHVGGDYCIIATVKWCYLYRGATQLSDPEAELYDVSHLDAPLDVFQLVGDTT